MPEVPRKPSPPTRPLWREWQAAKSRDTSTPRDYSAYLEQQVIALRRTLDRVHRRHIVALEEAYAKGYEAGRTFSEHNTLDA